MLGACLVVYYRVLTKLHLTMAEFYSFDTFVSVRPRDINAAEFYSFVSACERGDINAAVRILSAQEFDPRWLSREDRDGLRPLHYGLFH